MTSGCAAAPASPRGAFANFLEDDGFDRSAAISYYALFSLVPFLVIISLIGRKDDLQAEDQARREASSASEEASFRSTR